MSVNLAPGCDDAETGPRAVLAMMAAAEPAADPPKEGECSDMPGNVTRRATVTEPGPGGRWNARRGRGLHIELTSNPYGGRMLAAEDGCGNTPSR